MEALIGILLGLTIFLAVFAVGGHLLYLGLAALFRGLSGERRDRRTLCCPACHAELHLHRGNCIRCGCPIKVPESVARGGSAHEFERELRRLSSRGVIDQEQVVRLLAASRSDLESPWLPVEPAGPDEGEHKPASVPARHSMPSVARPVPALSSPAPGPALPAPVPVAAMPQSAAPATRQPAAALPDLLRAFMDENNIRWGEVLSGMLIVGSGIGLVISLWATLTETIPYFPALLFMLVTAAIHGAGMYTLHRWKLKSTSRGLLIISQCLIPLNYLAAVALSDKRPEIDWRFYTALATGLVVFGSVCYFAGRKLLLTGWWLLPVGVMGPSAGQVLISRAGNPQLDGLRVSLLFVLPLLGFLSAASGQLALAARWPRLTQRRIAQLLLVTGLALFALVVALGILLWKTGELRERLAELAPALSVVAAVILGTGGVLHRRLTGAALGAWRTAGTAIALTGGTLMLGCLLLPWPRPEILVAVGVVNFAAMTALALMLELGPLQFIAVLALALAGLIEFHLVRGHLFDSDGSGTALVRVLLRGQSGIVLLVISAVSAATAAVWSRFGKRAQAAACLAATAALAGTSVLVGAFAGFLSRVDGDLATIIFGICAVVLLVAVRRPPAVVSQLMSGRKALAPILGWTASLLAFAAFEHALGWNETVRAALENWNCLPTHPIATALLLHATLFAGLAFFVPRSPTRDPSDAVALSTVRSYVEVHGQSAVIASVIAAALAPLGLDLPPATLGGYAFWGAGVWLALAILHRSAGMFSAAQALASIALCLEVGAVCRRQTWWTGHVLGPTHLMAQMGSLAIWSALWVAIRRRLRDIAAASFVREAKPHLDRLLLGAVVAGVPVLAALACGPGIAAEMKIVVPITWPAGFPWLFVVALFALAAGMVATFDTCGRLAEAPPSGSHVPSVKLGRARSAHDRQEWRSYAVLAVVLMPFAILVVVPLWQLVSGGYWTLAGGAPANVFGAFGWLLWGIVGLALVIASAEHFAAPARFGWVWLLTGIPLLAAAPFETQNATASALRWSLALFGAALGLCARPLCRLMNRMASAGSGSDWIWNTGLALCLVPFLPLTLDTALFGALEGMLRGPKTASLFARLGAEWSLALPVAIVAATCCGRALFERLPRLALAGSFSMQLAVALFVVSFWNSHGVSLDGQAAVRFLQWNGIAVGAFSLAWFALRRRSEADDLAGAVQRNLVSPADVQMLMTATLGLVLPACAASAVIVSPGLLPPIIALLGEPISYAPLALRALAAIRWLRGTTADVGADWGWPLSQRGIVSIAVASIAAFALAAASAAPGNTAGNWVSYHLLMSGVIAVTLFTTTACLAPHQFQSALAILAGQHLPLDRPPLPGEEGKTIRDSAQELAHAASLCTSALGGLVLLLAARGVLTDPARPYWGTATTAVLAVLATILGLWRRSQIYAYTSARLAAMAASYAWTSPWLHIGLTPVPQSWVDLTAATAIAATLAGGFWLAVELWYERTLKTPFAPEFKYPPPHRGTSRLALIAACCLSLGALVARWVFFDTARPIPFDVSNAGGWLLIACLAGVLIGTLWDRRAKRNVPSLYVLGLAAAALLVDQCRPLGRDVPYTIALALACYVLPTSALWAMRDRLQKLALGQGVPEPDELLDRTAKWFPNATVALTLLVAATEVWVVLTFESLSWRLIGAGACALAAASLMLFAHEQGDEKRGTGSERHSESPDQVIDASRGACPSFFISSGPQWSFRELALLLLTLAAVQFGWALMPVDASPYFWLFRAVRLLVVLAAATFLFGVVSLRMLTIEAPWFGSMRRAATAVGGAALASLLATLAFEGYWFQQLGAAPLSGGQIALVAAVLVGLTAALVSLAVLPGRDLLDLSEAGRMLYVYAAEAVLGLLFLHVYFTMPELFHGYLLPYWPLIVMGIAYFGVGVGEIFRRANLPVLSEPLHRTGAFLPLLPALGFWVHASRMDHSTVLFIAGLMYVFVSLRRKDFIYVCAAALAGNAGLWALWHEHALRLFDHPQLWAIPPAISVLAAVHLNRERLSEDQATGLRYLCITLIYVSSTAEMFITGIAESLAMPMILALLSLAGAFAGIVLRVRAFLYLGSAFLLLSIVSMVWHAARNINHVWPWWAFGIGLGLAILTLLGVFEKKRPEVQLLLDQFRQWEP